MQVNPSCGGRRCGRDHDRVGAVVQCEVLDELCARVRIRLEREHSSPTAQLDRRADRVHPDVRADVDEVTAVPQVPRHEPQLALVVEAEVEVALQRLAQVEPEAHAGRKADERTALLRHRQSPPQAPFSPEVDTAEDRIENLRQHGGKLP